VDWIHLPQDRDPGGEFDNLSDY